MAQGTRFKMHVILAQGENILQKQENIYRNATGAENIGVFVENSREGGAVSRPGLHTLEYTMKPSR